MPRATLGSSHFLNVVKPLENSEEEGRENSNGLHHVVGCTVYFKNNTDTRYDRGFVRFRHCTSYTARVTAMLCHIQVRLHGQC